MYRYLLDRQEGQIGQSNRQQVSKPKSASEAQSSLSRPTSSPLAATSVAINVPVVALLIGH